MDKVGKTAENDMQDHKLLYYKPIFFMNLTRNYLMCLFFEFVQDIYY